MMMLKEDLKIEVISKNQRVIGFKDSLLEVHNANGDDTLTT